MPSAADKRAALLKERRAQQVVQPQVSARSAEEAARAHFLGASVIEALAQGRTVQAIPVEQIAPELRPELRQPRLLLLPEELCPAGVWNETERPQIDAMLALGESLRERQIHPIVVAEGLSARYPAARYLIVVGHRRWTAATLVGMPTLDALIIDPPSLEDRVTIQFSENEDRVDFCDMERAWTLERMRQLMSDAPWEVIERRVRVSESRRKQLMRLITFTPEQQRTLARLRASEFQLRPLHTAMREGGLAPDQVDRVIRQLASRAPTASGVPDASTASAPPALTSAVEQATVARLVAHMQRSAAPTLAPRPRWFTSLQQALQQARAGLDRATPKVGDLDAALRSDLQMEIDALLRTVETAVGALTAQELPTHEP